jgi:hypothetical protein
LHVVPQLIPPTLLVIVPVPVPELLTVSVYGTTEKLAEAVYGPAVPMVKLQLEPETVPGQLLQPANTEPAPAVGARLIAVVLANVAVQLAPPAALQLLMPAGVLVTVPVATPPFIPGISITFTVRLVGAKIALTDCAELMVTAQTPVPLHAPPQPLKTDPACAVGLSVTTVPLAKSAEHVVPHEIPAGVLVMDPAPVMAVAKV